MKLIWAAGLPIAVYLLGFWLYGRWLARAFGLSADAETPARRIDDGQDFVPTRPAVLLGQHFAAIAAVGPIAGPIIAGAKYGWLPGMLWITLGAVFVGGVHDLSALIISVRGGGRSVGDVFRDVLGARASRLFSAFIWLSLMYVILVFTDLTAAAFVSRPELGAEDFGPGVATSSLLYLGLSVALGLLWRRGRAPLWLTTLVFVPAVFGVIWLGQKLPIVFPGDALAQGRAWDLVILAYCVAASLMPMWLLLQPRGYLGGFILYSTFAAGILGLFFGGQPIQFPARAAPAAGVPAPALFPLLFTTIACGACSGFHGLVASGTTSKQLARETDARLVGYGGMLLESLVAVIAMATVMMLAPGSPELSRGPDEIYARGLAHFMQAFGIPFAAGVAFAKLAFATFIYDTLDVATRLGRYVIEESVGRGGRRSAFLAAAATVAVPLVTVFMTWHDAAGNPVPLWRIFWPAFGASNQLLAAMTLTGVTIWLAREGRNPWVTGLPAAFMTLVTFSSLGVLTLPWLKRVAQGRLALDPIGTTGLLLMLLAVAYLWEAARAAASLRARHDKMMNLETLA
ncbi:MAG: carbon starvation protein A [Elusimicrobia bacterium]|nr:carbon starvation protein A [Elusimicrobiota bacterium]